MAKVLIAFNNDVSEENRQFFEAYATDVRNYCYANRHDVEILCPPNLTEDNFMRLAGNCVVCYVASHGTTDSVVNEKWDPFVSIRTTNYNLAGKCFFAVSCNCAGELRAELLRIGLKLFVGYRNEYTDYIGSDEFQICANSGLKFFINGCTVAEMRKHMEAEYDKYFDILNQRSAIMADALLDNKEALVIDGEDALTINDLI